MIKQLIIIFFLGFSSGLPISLVSSTLQAWFADAGLSIWVTGLMSLISVPYLYRFLWAPLLDRYSLLNLGKRRSWILLMQVLISIGLYLLSGCSPHHSPWIMAGLTLCIATCSATQDAAIDAHRTEYLSLPLHGLGASIATLAYRLALLVSGGLALVIAQNYGWQVTYRLMSGLMVFGMIAIAMSPEPSKPSQPDTPLLTLFIDPVRELLSRHELLSFCLFIIFFKTGEVFTSCISGIVMPFFIQGLHFSLATIGYVTKVWGVVAIIMGGVVGGAILVRHSLYQSLLCFGLLQALTNGIFIALATTKPQTWLLMLAVFSDNFAAGMGSTALVALMMRFVDQRFTATQFSILASMVGVPRVMSGPIGAFFQEKLGWSGLYIIAFMLALAFIPFLYRLRRQPIFQMKKYPNN